MKTKKWVNEFRSVNLHVVTVSNIQYRFSAYFNVYVLIFLRYGGFSLGAKSSQAVDEPLYIEESVLGIRRRYSIAEVRHLIFKISFILTI